MRRKREDQEASSPFFQDLGLASELGGVEFVTEEERGLVEDDGVSDLEDGSSEESFVSSHEEGEVVPDDCLDGLALTFRIEPALELVACKDPIEAPPPLAVQFPVSPIASPPRALLAQEAEGSSKSLRVKGLRRELRNLEFGMSFGRKEAGSLSRNQ